jgi:hypothetical protein
LSQGENLQQRTWTVRKLMDIEEQIRNIMFEIGKDIKIHKIDSDNSIIEVDYEKYIKKILQVFLNYSQD